MRTATRRATLIIVATAAIAAGCGGSSSSKAAPAAYVKSICSAIAPFEKDVQSRSTALNLTSISNATAGKQALVGFLNAVVADTDQAVSKLKAAGTPNVSSGKAISNAIVSAFTQLRGALSEAATQAHSLPTDSPLAFKNAAVALSRRVQNSMNGIGASLGNLNSPTLEAAAAQDPTCKRLASG